MDKRTRFKTKKAKTKADGAQLVLPAATAIGVGASQGGVEALPSGHTIPVPTMFQNPSANTLQMLTMRQAAIQHIVESWQENCLEAPTLSSLRPEHITSALSAVTDVYQLVHISTMAFPASVQLIIDAVRPTIQFCAPSELMFTVKDSSGSVLTGHFENAVMISVDGINFGERVITGVLLFTETMTISLFSWQVMSSFKLFAFLPSGTEASFSKSRSWSIGLQTCYRQLSNLLPIQLILTSPSSSSDSGEWLDGETELAPATDEDFEQFFLQGEAAALASAWGMNQSDFVSDLEGCDACSFEFFRKLTPEDIAARSVRKTNMRFAFFKNPVNTEKVFGLSKEAMLTPGPDGGPPMAAINLSGRLVAKSQEAWTGSMRAVLLDHFNEPADPQCRRVFQTELDLDHDGTILVNVCHIFDEASSMFVTRFVGLRCEPERRSELEALLQKSVKRVNDARKAEGAGPARAGGSLYD
jgi:hypothetical protein